MCGCWLGGLSQKKSIQLWQKVLKNISARFGTGILSYFIFLRRLLLYNILFFLINGLFLLLPQISNPPPHSKDEHTDFWILTGTVRMYILKSKSFILGSLCFCGFQITQWARGKDVPFPVDLSKCPALYYLPNAIVLCSSTGFSHRLCDVLWPLYQHHKWKLPS